MNKLNKKFFLNRKFLDVLNLLIILIIVFVGLSILSPNAFLTTSNFLTMASQMGEFGIFTLAMLVVMLTGGINLSIVTGASFAGIIMGTILIRFINPESSNVNTVLILILAIVVSISISLLIGLINGLLIGFLGISAILITLGTMMLLQGASIVITKDGAVSGFPDMFLFISNGTLLGIPMPFLIFVVCALITAVYLNKTATGFSFYMIGSNEKVTSFSGINNRIVILKAYLISGLLSGVAALVMTARFNTARSDIGGSYLLQSILVVLLGGVSAHGGHGTISGVIIAIIILQFLASGFNLLGLSTFLITGIWGLMLILAIVMNHFRNKYIRTIMIKDRQ